MNFILFNKNTPILNFSFNDYFQIEKINEEFDLQYAPYGIVTQGTVNKIKLNKWWANRSIPASRHNLEKLIEHYKLQNQFDLLKRSYALSLSDQYWIMPENSSLTWNKVNFFENDFSDDIGELLFNDKLHSKHDFNFCSPDNTSEGQLIKRWKIIGNKRCLLKKGTKGLPLEVYNEVIASKILDKLNYRHVKYNMFEIDNDIVSCCNNFITPNTELITANDVIESEKKPNHLSIYAFLKQKSEEFGIKDFDEQMSKMLAFDFIIANRDRHFRNFGFIRDVNTLKFKGMAPIFDNGTSLWNDKFDKLKFETLDYKSKPFIETPLSQLKWIKQPEIIDLSKLTELNYIIESTFLNNTKFSEWSNEICGRITSQIEILRCQLEKLIKKNQNYEIKPKSKLVTKAKEKNGKTNDYQR